MKLVSATLCVLLLASPCLARQELPQVLLPSVVTSPQYFGGATAAGEGDRLLVGASVEGDGAVYAFERLSPTEEWIETQRIEPPSATPLTGFGQLIDVEGDLAAIGTAGSGLFSVGGAVLIYRHESSTGSWTHSQTISPPGAQLFGVEVALENDLLIITEAWAMGTWFGHVHLYQRNPLSDLFEPLQVIENVERHFNNRFATDAELLDEDTLILSDPQLSANRLREAGGLMIYRRNAVTGLFTESARLHSPNPVEAGSFGWSIAWDGRQLLAAEFRKGPTLIRHSGRLYVYERSGPTDFRLVQTITSPTFLERSGLTRILDLEDGQLAVQDRSPIGAPPSYNVVQSYQRDDATGFWFHVGSLLDPEIPMQADGASGAVFTDSSLVTSSARSTFPSAPQGRAFAYDLRDLHGIGRAYCVPANSLAPTLAVRGQAEEGGVLVLRTTGLPSRAWVQGLVSFHLDMTPLAGGAKLCMGGPIGRVLQVPLAASIAGSLTTTVDLDQVPGSTGNRPAIMGDLMYVQTWSRGPNSAGTPMTSNAVSVEIK